MTVTCGWLASPCTAASTSLCLSRENAQEQGLEVEGEGWEGEEDDKEEGWEGGGEVVGWDWAIMNNSGNTNGGCSGDDDAWSWSWSLSCDVRGRGSDIVRLWASLANCS